MLPSDTGYGQRHEMAVVAYLETVLSLKYTKSLLSIFQLR